MDNCVAPEKAVMSAWSENAAEGDRFSGKERTADEFAIARESGRIGAMNDDLALARSHHPNLARSMLEIEFHLAGDLGERVAG